MKPYWQRQEAIEKLETEVEELRDKIGWRKMKAILEFNLPEDEENLCGTVYGYVPCSIIDEVIEKHGGIDESKITEISQWD